MKRIITDDVWGKTLGYSLSVTVVYVYVIHWVYNPAAAVTGNDAFRDLLEIWQEAISKLWSQSHKIWLSMFY